MTSGNLTIRKFRQDITLYMMLVIPIIMIFIFSYVPMTGILIAFKKLKLSESFVHNMFYGEWAGLKYFSLFVKDMEFWRAFKNTFIISILSLLFGFPAPIILAILLNEVRSMKFKRITQTISYLPHFLSVVIIIGLMMQLLSPSTGIVNGILKALGMEQIYFMTSPEWFRPLYIISEIWQGIGWGSIIYMASIASLDPQLYEAAEIDGAGRFRKIFNITIPGIMPTIIILFLMNIGSVLQVGFEKVLIMQGNSFLTLTTSDVIETFVFRRGIRGSQYSFATAVGLFKSVVGIVLLVFANRLSRKFTETSLW